MLQYCSMVFLLRVYSLYSTNLQDKVAKMLKYSRMYYIDIALPLYNCTFYAKSSNFSALLKTYCRERETS